VKYPDDVLHASPQLPAPHVALPFAGPAHTVQLGPQCEMLSGLTHAPLHASNPVPQAMPHVPVVHVPPSQT
jgi:hypothetical protein